MPIVNNYASPLHSIGISEFALLIFVPIILLEMLRLKSVIKIHGYMGFFIYGVVISLLMLLFHPDFSAYDVGIRLLRDSFYVCIIFVFAQKYFNVEYAIKLYKSLAIITSTYLILQYMSYYIFNYKLPWVLQGVDLNYAVTDITEYLQNYARINSYYFRPTSIFLEPAQFAQFIAPFLALTLFPCTRRQRIDYKLAMFLTASMILSTSANAYALVLVIWTLWYVYNSLITKRYEYIIVYSIIILLAIVAIFYLYKSNGEFNQVVSRFFTIGNGTTSSANVRLLGGIYFYTALDPIFKFFGIGFGNYNGFTRTYSVLSLYGIQKEYMNSLSYILVSSGITGLLIFLFILHRVYIKSSLSSRILLILLIILCLSSSIYSSPMYVVLFTLILYLPKDTAKDVSFNGMKKDPIRRSFRY